MYGCFASTVYQGPQGDYKKTFDRLELELSTVLSLLSFEAIPGSKKIDKGL